MLLTLNVSTLRRNSALTKCLRLTRKDVNTVLSEHISLTWDCSLLLANFYSISACARYANANSYVHESEIERKENLDAVQFSHCAGKIPIFSLLNQPDAVGEK
jgi:hypothetical protein